MKKSWHIAFFIAVFLFVTTGNSQRIYAPHSVLASGSWYKLSVKKTGVYKIDLPFLNSLGVNTSNLAASSIKLYGNGGSMLAEANQSYRPDDLVENAIKIEDGGDGILNGNDYILFFASGPDEWMKDSLNSRFSHRKNLYTDKAFYYITIGTNGKRIQTAPVQSQPGIIVNSFSERFFHELDSVNFLSSGKEWYGEEFANAPGKLLSRNFEIDIPDIINGAPIVLQSSCAARSIGATSRFSLRIGNQSGFQQTINPVGAGPYDFFVQQSTSVFSGIATQSTVAIQYNYEPGSFTAQGWLNWFELFTRRSLSLNNTQQLLFRDWLSVGNNAAEFIINNAPLTTQVWDVTSPLSPLLMPGNFSGSTYRFANSVANLKEYVAFTNTNFLIPNAEGKVVNQDLHNSTPVNYLIVSYPSLLSQAEQLAQIHRQRNGISVAVFTTEQIYNEFSCGNPDPTAIRDFVKMYYDRYASSSVDKLKYLLLFGDASFDFKDRIANNTNLLPSFQSQASIDPLTTYASDDFYGFLDDNEDINSGLLVNYLDIGIGRVPAKNAEEAQNFVNKVATYLSPESFGPWRNNFTFIADDEDNNLHIQDAELVAATSESTAPFFNRQKIYLDAYQQESGVGGSSYPLANQAFNNQIFAGTLICNYNGHGGSRRLAEETILDQEIVNKWANEGRLPLFITATCDFAPYDNPITTSIGENILLRTKTGAIALMTTTRLVFAFSNRIMNNNYIQFALQRASDGTYKSLGDAVKEAKNFTYQTSGDVANNRKFTLLGDPALTIGFPTLGVNVTSVNGIPATQADTLKATEKISIEGEVTDISGNSLPGFSGNVFPVIYDKPQSINTLANDPGSQVTSFQTQSNVLFKGKASITNGRFAFDFIVPKDINFQYGNGRLSLYAENGSNDGNGLFTNFIIGGTGTNGGSDNVGPEIKAWLNDEQFVNGGITNQNPILIVKLTDSSGVNTTGTGIGHDIIATLDNDNQQYFNLNDYYQADLNSFQQGVVRFQLPELPPGPHTISIKAWDVLNNSNQATLDFTVANDEELELSHVLNYPNPFSTSTNFWFEHNKPGQELQVFLQIMTVSGKVIKSIRKAVFSDGNRVSDLHWDGRDEYGDKPGRGVYIYRLRVTAPDKKQKEVIGKLVIL